MTADPCDLQRFVAAQQGVMQDVLDELASGLKQSHWMWFVFPQIAGLGHSAMAQRYAISSLAEAVAYASHPVLGERLRECTRRVLAVQGRTAREIFGSVDAQKLHSSMTLFALAQPDEPVFKQVIDRYFAGVPDEGTLQRVQ